MNIPIARLRAWMTQAVEVSTRHVQAGGLPFVAVLVTDEGPVSDHGVNLVRETGDPTAHAEIVAMRQALADGGTSLRGTVLLATGEPCALCYRFADAHGVDAVHFAVGRDTAAAWGFDYRAGYEALGIDGLPVTQAAQHLPVEGGLGPFTRYAQLHSLSPAPVAID